MSILIKGMDKETAVRICAYAGVRMDDSDFIPVPPHGDLIERNAAYDKIAEQEGGNYIDMDAVNMGLNETPTIIEAEEETT